MSEPRHPFLKGLSKHRGAPPTILVIFGASGDLNARKLVPALYNLCLDALLPTDFRLVGFSRTPMADSAFQALLTDSVKKFSRRPLREDVYARALASARYFDGGYDDPAAFTRLAALLDELKAGFASEPQFLFYISTPPGVFCPILRNLGASGLASRHRGTPLETKVVIEKPFGRDLASARELNAAAREVLSESQIYRIDHYLGKETVQDLLVQRFGNSIFEPLWNRQYVSQVQITVAEEHGVGSRGGYYDNSGAMRDMIQNHTMQLLALIAMEPPVSLDAESIRDEKVKVLKAIQPLRLDREHCDVVRARYTEGVINGVKVPGYLQEKDIPASSATETYAAFRLSINNWRWKGVPFYLRSGKRLARRVSEIAIEFKRPPGILFTEGDTYHIAPNTLVIRIQPDEGTALILNSKVPGLEPRTQPVKMHFRYATTFGSNTPEAYERLILDAIVGDSTLFIRGDETEASWKLVSPLLEHWKQLGSNGLAEYAAGSWGPLEAERLLWENHHEWRRPGP